MVKTVSKRILVTLPDSIYEDLEAWAKGDGRPVANLAGFILESEVIAGRNDGRIDVAKQRLEAAEGGNKE